MADAAERARWWHTASVMSVVANIMRGKSSKFVSAKDLHPMERREESHLVVESMSALVGLKIGGGS